MLHLAEIINEMSKFNELTELEAMQSIAKSHSEIVDKLSKISGMMTFYVVITAASIGIYIIGLFLKEIK